MSENGSRIYGQVSGNQLGKITEGQFVGFQATIGTDRSQLRLKHFKLLGDLSAARDFRVPALGPKPGRDLLDALTRIGAMGVDVCARNVGDEPLIAVLLPVENKCPLVSLVLVPIALGPKEQTELQGHIEPGQRRVAIHLRPGNIVNAVRHSSMIAWILASRFSDESSASSAHRGLKPERRTVNTIAQKTGL